MFEKYKNLLDFDSSNLIARLLDYGIEDLELLVDCIYIVLNFTNQEKVPWQLERLLYSMCIDYNKLLINASAEDNNAKSITRGDFKIEFKDDTEVKKYAQSQLLQNYSNDLVEFRKLRF